MLLEVVLGAEESSGSGAEASSGVSSESPAVDVADLAVSVAAAAGGGGCPP